MKKFLKIIFGIFFATAILGGFYLFAKRDALLDYVLNYGINYAEEHAPEFIGTKIKIGSAAIQEFSLTELKDSALILYDVEIFDKNSELIAQVDRAEIILKLLNLQDNGAGAIETINLSGAQAFIKKRGDNSWNVQDIKLKDSGESTFNAEINLTGGTVSAEFDGKKISVENIEGTADCADLTAIETEIYAETLGSKINATGTLSTEKQIINAVVDTADVSKILPYLPKDTLPENIEIQGGTASNAAVNILRRGELLSYSGYTDFSGGAVRLLETDITDINGTATFTDSEYVINANAAANGQNASVFGKIRTDTDEIYFDVNAASENFAPAAVIENIGIVGAASFTAHVFGTIKDPKVEADIHSNYLAYENISARNISTKLRYVNNAVFLSNIYAESFGGSVTGEAEITAETLAYNAHLKAHGINILAVRNYIGADFPIFGDVDADVAVNGTGADFTTLTAYGSANAKNITCQNFLVSNAETSFYYKNNDVRFDYLNLKLPNNGTLNLEGTLLNRQKLDLDFYAAHIDLSLAKKFNSAIDVSGLSDFNGSIHGDLDNPQVKLVLSAVTGPRGSFPGVVFNQEYDSIDLEMSGSFDAVNFEKFELEKDGKVQWQVMDGWINFKEQTLNVRLDTVGARLEGIVELIAPDQELTGQIDNTIRAQGSFKNFDFTNLELVGYVEMKYGSYKGFLISSMRGDYFIEHGGNFRLQDFEIITPMVDMVLNGTINIKTYALDFVVRGREIDLRRFQSKIPYPVSGVGKFEGLIGGNISAPKFDGQLTSNLFVLNGVDVKNIQGHVSATNNTVILDDTHFTQGNGKYSVFLTADIDSGAMKGFATVEKADIKSMAALANADAKFFNGELTSHIEFGGTMDNPSVKVTGGIEKGTIGTYDVHNVLIAVNFANYVATINQLHGYQGDAGEFEVLGTADLNGDLKLTAKATDIELGIFGAIAGVDADFVGTSSISARLSGDINNPFGDLNLTASGGVKGSTFDLLTSHILFYNWTFDIQELTVERTIDKKTYSIGASGTIPVEALYLENDAPSAGMNVKISLDEAELSLLPVLSKMVGWATGEMAGTITVNGTIQKPLVYGIISLADGTINIKGMKNLIEHFNILAEFNGEKFIVDDISGNIGDGKFTLRGGLTFSDFTISNYTFDFVADALDIRTDFFTGPLNAEFSLNEEPFFNRNLPKLQGKIDFDKCLFSIPAIPDSEGELPEILLDVKINLGEQVHFYSSRLYNMYLNGSVRYEGSTNHPKPSGVISVKRGATLNYISTVFDVTEGELHFNQMDSFFPSVNFQAGTRLTDIRVNLSATGTLNEMDVQLTSNPEKSQTEIIQILTLRDAYGNQTSNMTMADILAIGLQMSILGDIEDSVRRNLGFDRFTFASGSGSALDSFTSKDMDNGQRNDDFHISVGKYVTDKLMLKYTQGINGEKITRFGFQYDLNDNLGFTVEHEKSDFIFSLEARYKF